jgi:hypothetical protein
MDWNLWILKWSGSDPMTCVIEKEEVVELLKKLGHRIIEKSQKKYGMEIAFVKSAKPPTDSRI